MSPPQITPTTKPTNRNQLKVLLVDDDSFQLDLMTEILKGLGISDVTEVTSGPKGLEKLSAKGAGFHLVLLDLHMPGMDGTTLAAKIREAGHTLPLVLFTSLGRQENTSGLFAASLAKPLHQSQLFDTLVTLLAPGRGTTGSLAWRTPATSRAPGSLMAGVPASLT